MSRPPTPPDQNRQFPLDTVASSGSRRPPLVVRNDFGTIPVLLERKYIDVLVALLGDVPVAANDDEEDQPVAHEP